MHIVWDKSSVSFFWCECPAFLTLLLNRLSFLHCISECLSENLIEHKGVGIILGSLSYHVVKYLYFYDMTMLLWYYNFFKNDIMSFSFIIFVQDGLDYLGSFVFQNVFGNSFYYIFEKCHWNFHRNFIESVDHFGKYGNLTTVIRPF